MNPGTSQFNAQFPDVEEVMNSKSYLAAYQKAHGNYAANWAEWPACRECGQLNPEMRFQLSIRNFCDADFSTACCGSATYDWKYVVGTRRTTSRLVLLRGKELKQRGIWSAMAM